MYIKKLNLCANRRRHHFYIQIVKQILLRTLKSQDK
jgi:hypothetical protein